METKAFPAFGHTVLRRSCAKGEVITDEDYTDGVIEIVEPWPTTWVITKGLIHQINVETGQVSVRGPGYNSVENREKAGLWRCVFVEDSIVFCVPGGQNKNLINTVEPFVLRAGQKTTLPRGTKLSLFQGLLSVGGATVREMRQLEVKTGDKEATAVEDCYGLIFP